jgi:predicted transcriptional regulator
VEVVEPRLFETPAQMAELLPAGLEEPFTTAHLSEVAEIRRSLAQKACYCLRKMGAIEKVGTKGNAYLYRRNVA